MTRFRGASMVVLLVMTVGCGVKDDTGSTVQGQSGEAGFTVVHQEQFEFGDGHRLVATSREPILTAAEAYDEASHAPPGGIDGHEGVVRYGSYTAVGYGKIEGIEHPGDPGGTVSPSIVD